MGLSDWIKGGLSVIALIVSVAAYLANRQTARANERMAKANDEANAINRDLLDANQKLVAINERMAASTELSSQAAREAADSAIAANRESKMAVIELVTRGNSAIGSRKSDETGSFILKLRNEGQATAYDLSVLGVLSVNRQGIQPVTLGRTLLAQIEPGEEKDCDLPVTKFQFGDVDTREVEIIVNYKDGLGKQETRFTVRILNYWDQA